MLHALVDLLHWSFPTRTILSSFVAPKQLCYMIDSVQIKISDMFTAENLHEKVGERSILPLAEIFFLTFNYWFIYNFCISLLFFSSCQSFVNFITLEFSILTFLTTNICDVGTWFWSTYRQSYTCFEEHLQTVALDTSRGVIVLKDFAVSWVLMNFSDFLLRALYPTLVIHYEKCIFIIYDRN